MSRYRYESFSAGKSVTGNVLQEKEATGSKN